MSFTGYPKLVDSSGHFGDYCRFFHSDKEIEKRGRDCYIGIEVSTTITAIDCIS